MGHGCQPAKKIVGLLRTTQGSQHHGHQEILEVSARARPVHAQHNGDLERKISVERACLVAAKGLTTGGLQK